MGNHESQTRRVEALPQNLLANLPILIVDDEDVILRAISRLLREVDAEVLTAATAEEALEVLEEHEVSVIMSDQRMPGLTGTELLHEVTTRHPDVVRVMITGNNDTDTAIEAINRGEVFRFIAKPWDNEALIRTANDALEISRLRRSKAVYEAKIEAQNVELKSLNEDLEARVKERTAEVVEKANTITTLYGQLERSFDATMKALLSTMELGHSSIATHCQRTEKRVEKFAPVVGIEGEALKHVRRAALLHWLGLINAPESVFSTPLEEFNHDEQAYWEFHPLLGQQAISHVPVLKSPSRLILLYLTDWPDDDEGAIAQDQPFEITREFIVSCQVLRMCSTFERMRTIGSQRRDDWHHLEEGLAAIQSKRGTAFDPKLVDQFVQFISKDAMGMEKQEVQVELAELKPGMALARPVETSRGIPVAARGMIVTAELVERFQNFAATTGLDSIYVWTP